MVAGFEIYDCWVNLNPPEQARGRMSGDAYLFHDEERFNLGSTVEQLLAEMDACGIRKALLSAWPRDPVTESIHGMDFGNDLQSALKVAEQHPDRFSVAVRLQPREGMGAVRKLERLVKDHGVVAAKVGADTVLAPYDDKIYYPIYAKCAELGIPITVNVGFPAPRAVPSKYQDPLPIDEVCWFFPELTVVMAHVGEPWVRTIMSLLVKWPNLYLMTSAYAPKHYPQELLHFMNTRGGDKVLFATDYPLLTMHRCVSELGQLPLRDYVWPKFLRENAERVFNWSTPAKSGAPFV